MKSTATILRGLKLKEARIKKDLSLRQLAEKVSEKLGSGRSISYGAINRYEEGSACDMDVLFVICEILDLDALKLLDECMKEAKKEYDRNQKNDQ